MSITIPVTTPSRIPVTYHKVHKVETSENFANATIYVKSYIDATAESQEYLTWMWQLSLPLESINSLNPVALETLLTENPNSPFYMGILA